LVASNHYKYVSLKLKERSFEFKFKCFVGYFKVLLRVKKLHTVDQKLLSFLSKVWHPRNTVFQQQTGVVASFAKTVLQWQLKNKSDFIITSYLFLKVFSALSLEKSRMCSIIKVGRNDLQQEMKGTIAYWLHWNCNWRILQWEGKTSKLQFFPNQPW
jgi:hypothetical protein